MGNGALEAKASSLVSYPIQWFHAFRQTSHFSSTGHASFANTKGRQHPRSETAKAGGGNPEDQSHSSLPLHVRVPSSAPPLRL